MRRQRKKRFIDFAVQGALIRRIVLHWLIFFTVMVFLLPLWKIMQTGDFSSPFSTMMVRGWADSAPAFIILLAMIPIFVWDTVTLSHRFAGPMYRFRNTIRDLAAGKEVRPLKFRDGDFWQDVAVDFNTMVDNFRSEQEHGATDDAMEDEPACVGCGAEEVS